MRAIQIIAPGNAQVVDVPVPQVKDDEVLVKVKSCVTCPHWDITLFRGVDIFERPGFPKYPIPAGYPGHEMAGEVTAVGKKVKAFKVGDRVATIIAGGEDRMGFYCEFINRPASTVVKVPKGISDDAAASMEMSRYVSAFVRLLGDVSGKRTGVTGVGPAGLIALQMLKALGAREVVAVDMLDDRLALAKKLGATETVNAGTDQIKRLESAPLQASVDCSGIASGLQTALDHTRGSISIFGVPHGDIKYGIRHWGRNLLSSGNPTADDTAFVLKLWRAGKLDTGALVSARLPFEKYADGIQRLMARKAVKIAYCPEGPWSA